MAVDTKNIRNTIITIFVIVWIGIFHYESIRYFYLQPLLKKELPKVKLLFPPAGWIMFFKVEDDFAYVDVFGVKGNVPYLIDAHDIFRTRTIGFDNIHRNILGTVLEPGQSKPFCRFLNYRFPQFDRFIVVSNYYPSLTKNPTEIIQKVQYQCPNSL